VRADVAAVLFDEPLTVIDPHLKWQLRRKLKQIHHELKLTLIYVTHDQVEALTFADQVVVMSRGRVMQVGTPDALFERPAHTFVGHFIGSPGMNFLPVQCRRGRVGARRMPVAPALQAQLAAGALQLGMRPEYLRLARRTRRRVPARCAGAGHRHLPDADRRLDGHTLKARLPPARRCRPWGRSGCSCWAAHLLLPQRGAAGMSASTNRSTRRPGS
jgi:glycerol transport system ATP-binding protein